MAMLSPLSDNHDIRSSHHHDITSSNLSFADFINYDQNKRDCSCIKNERNVFIKFERFVVEKQDILKNCSSLLDSKVKNPGTILEPKFRVYDLCSIVDQTPKDMSLKVDRLLQSSDLSQQDSEVQGSLFKFPKFPFAQGVQYVLFKSNTSESFNQTTAKNCEFRPDIIQLTGSSRSLDTFSNSQQQEDNMMLLTPNQKSRSLEIYPCCKKLVCMTIVGSMKWDKNKKGRERLVFLPRHLLFRKNMLSEFSISITVC